MGMNRFRNTLLPSSQMTEQPARVIYFVKGWQRSVTYTRLQDGGRLLNAQYDSPESQLLAFLMSWRFEYSLLQGSCRQD